MNKNKFIIYNHTPNQINDLQLFELVYDTIKQGYLSNNETEYCYLTIFGKENRNVVSTRKTKTGYRFDIYNDNKMKELLKEKQNETK